MCDLLGQHLNELAAKYPSTKFVKIVSTECIKNYPDNNLPTVLVYNSTNVKATLVGLHRFGGSKCTPEGQWPKSAADDRVALLVFETPFTLGLELIA